MPKVKIKVPVVLDENGKWITSETSNYFSSIPSPEMGMDDLKRDSDPAVAEKYFYLTAEVEVPKPLPESSPPEVQADIEPETKGKHQSTGAAVRPTWTRTIRPYGR